MAWPSGSIGTTPLGSRKKRSGPTLSYTFSPNGGRTVDSPAERIRTANEVILANGNLDAIEEFFMPDYRVHLTGREMSGGHGMIRRTLGRLRRAFPDVRVEVEITDRVAWQRTLCGLQEGPFQGFPASGHLICGGTW